MQNNIAWEVVVVLAAATHNNLDIIVFFGSPYFQAEVLLVDGDAVPQTLNFCISCVMTG